MASDEITTQILIQIRDEIRVTNQRIDAQGGRIDHLGQRMDQLVEAQHVTTAEIHQLVGLVTTLTTHLKGQLELRDRVATCERDIADLKSRVS